MFDQETAQFFQMLRSNTIGDSSSIGLRSVLESNIPANVKAFFRADVEWLRTQEKAREVRSSKFSFTIPEVRLLDEQIDLLLVNNYTFTRKDFEATADKCIHFLLNYLCRPQWTLSSFFFDAGIRITSDEMLAKLRYCADYSYFRAVLVKYAEARQRTDVGSEEMKRLLKTIDEEVCGNATPKELTVIARPIFDFVGAIRASMQPPLPARVPVRALIYFFEDKKLAKFSNALTAVREMDNGIELTPAMLEMVLEAATVSSIVPDLTALSAAAEHEAQEEQTAARAFSLSHPAGIEHRAAEDQHAADIPAAHDEHEEQAGDDFGEEQRGLSTAVEGAPEAHTAIAPDDLPRPVAADDDDEVHRMMYQRQADIVVSRDETPEPPADHLEPAENVEAEPRQSDGGPTVVAPPYFSDSDRQAIVSTLFNGDEAMFNEAIGAAANSHTWDEAIITLDRFFAEQGIDPFSKEAMMFANILESWHRTLSSSDPGE
jgi:hypothetical protein